MLHSLSRGGMVVGLVVLVLVIAGGVVAAPAGRAVPVIRSEVAPPIVRSMAQIQQSASIAPNFSVVLSAVVSSGLTQPVAIANAGDGSGRLFVLEQAGHIRIIKNGALLGTPYLTLTNIVECCGEQGLLGLVFDPNFETNRTFYINYTTSAPGFTGDTVVARYQVANATADVANVLAVTNIITIDQPESNHNGGDLHFGPDGYLYIGMGDGGGGGDQHGTIGNGQNPATLLGKMLRINVRGVPTYTVPASNPFTQTVGYRPEIWAIGLRNPWRFSFDRGTGDLFIGDVGQDCYEEIDYQPVASHGGENYGWRRLEGFHAFDPAQMSNCNQPTPTPPDVTLPIVEVAHPTGEAIVGGYVYRGSTYPAIQGVYFYADEVTGRFWMLEHINSAWVSTEINHPGLSISSFGEDQSGELYAADYNSGTIYKIISAPIVPPAPDLSTSAKTVSPGAAQQGNIVTYTIVLRNSGGAFTQTVRVTDTVPGGLSYLSGSFTATLGTPNASSAPTLKWNGVMSTTPVVTLTYAVTVATTSTTTITNMVTINPGYALPFTRMVSVLVNPRSVFLPLMLRR
jgi:uncharacterized repeat protein (TIGR01451 family)